MSFTGIFTIIIGSLIMMTSMWMYNKWKTHRKNKNAPQPSLWISGGNDGWEYLDETSKEGICKQIERKYNL